MAHAFPESGKRRYGHQAREPLIDAVPYRIHTVLTDDEIQTAPLNEWPHQKHDIHHQGSHISVNHGLEKV